jgi:hypothetical protein
MSSLQVFCSQMVPARLLYCYFFTTDDVEKRVDLDRRLAHLRSRRLRRGAGAMFYLVMKAWSKLLGQMLLCYEPKED